MAAEEFKTSLSATGDDASPEAPDSTAVADLEGGPWKPPPAQPIRIGLALLLSAAASVLYGFVLTSFWSSPDLGIHDRVPYPAYLLIALALATALAGLGTSLGIWSPHAKLAIGLLAFFACVAIGVGGGRFVSYTLHGTLNPRFNLGIARGDRFPDFALADQNGAIHTLRTSPAPAMTLVVVYRGDFCPFARFELAELSAHADELKKAGVNVVAISADPRERSAKLAAFLNTPIPLLSDQSESLLRPLGLVQHYRDGRPDSSIPADFLLDREYVVRWSFTSPYYRELPSIAALLQASRSVPASP